MYQLISFVIGVILTIISATGFERAVGLMSGKYVFRNGDRRIGIEHQDRCDICILQFIITTLGCMMIISTCITLSIVYDYILSK